MDAAKADELEERLKNKALDGWIVERLINYGKSAAVFAAHKDGLLGAVKVFDTELIERYGDNAQLARIERELELRGHTHDNLVSIYGGGFDAENDLYFVVMEYLDGPNLKDALPDISIDQVPSLLRQLASAAKFLEDHGLVHRDIKPENIALLENGRRLVLLDFGVIRPIKGSSVTDPEGLHAFIGTLQYSSPEFLLREEKQDIDGWRSLTFYQIGAVLHDLIVKRPIFEQFAHPYAKLVNAVQHERPTIINPDAAPQLIQLAERCLLKNPISRLRMLRWEDFFQIESEPGLSARDRVIERLVTVRAQADEANPKYTASIQQEKTLRKNVMGLLTSAAATARASVAGLPPFRFAKCPTDESCLDFEFQRRPDQGFRHGLVIRVFVEVIDARESVIACSGCALFAADRDDRPMRDASFQTWFEGPLDNVLFFHQSFESFLFAAIEWCLQVSPGIDDPGGLLFGRVEES